MREKQRSFSKHAQAALEFLITYGWAFLVILIMIGALAHFGILSPANLIPQSCIAQYPFECTDVVYHGVNPTIGGNAGQYRVFPFPGIVVILRAQANGVIQINASGTKMSDSHTISDPGCFPGTWPGGTLGLVNSANNKDGAFAKLQYRDEIVLDMDDTDGPSSPRTTRLSMDTGTYRFDEGDEIYFVVQCTQVSTIDAVNFEFVLDYTLSGKTLSQKTTISGRQKLSDNFIADDGNNLNIGGSILPYKP